MSKTIKLEIPAEPEYQAAAAAFFNVLTGEGVDHRVVTSSGPGKELSPGVTEITKEKPADDLPPPGDDLPPPPGDEEELDAGSVFSGTGEESEVDDGIERDAEGLPWDERIHSSGKNDDGTYKKYGSGKDAGKWQRRRGVTEEITATVKAELLSAAPAPTETGTSDDLPPPGDQGGDDLPPPPGDDVTVEARPVNNFPELMALVQELKGAAKITDDKLNELAATVAGVPNVALMATKLDFIPALGAAIVAEVGL